MPWVLALLALGGLGLVASGSRGGSGSSPVNADLVRAWSSERGLVAYVMGPGWDPGTACFDKLTCGTRVDIIIDSQGRFWRPDPAGTGKCSSGADLKRAFLAWQSAL